MSTDFNKVANDVAQGGAWTDDKLDQPLDWAGETGSSHAAIDATKTYPTKTYEEIEQDILKDANLTQDTINTITTRVERALLRSSGSSNKTLIQLVDGQVEEHRTIIRDWIAGQNKKIHDLEERLKDIDLSHISRLDEKISSMEHKIETLVGSITQYGPEEVRVLHEAHNIIKARQSSDVGDTDEPSIYGRMEKRMEDLTAQLRAVEPFADQAITRTVKSAQIKPNIMKKFGRMM